MSMYDERQKRIAIAKNHGMALRDLIGEYRKARRKIDADGRITDEAKRGDRDKLRAWAQGELERITSATQAAIDQVNAMTRHLVQEASPRETDTAKLARIQTEEQAWRRCERMIKSGVSIADVIAHAGRMEDRAALAALKGELPSMLAQPHQAQELSTLTSVLDVTERPLLSSDEREARDTNEAMKWAAYSLTMNAGFTRTEVVDDGMAASLLVDGSTPRATIAVSEAA